MQLSEKQLDRILGEMRDLGYKVFENDNSINLIPIRSPERRIGAFDDWVCLIWFVGGEVFGYVWPATTDPGRKYSETPMRLAGAAIMVPGQNLAAYRVRTHGKRRYAALTQTGKVKIGFWRDNDKDSDLDIPGYRKHLDRPPDEIDYIGANVHASDNDPFDDSDRNREGSDPEIDYIGVWGAGCIVFADSADYREYWAIVKSSTDIYGSYVSLTLLDADPEDCFGLGDVPALETKPADDAEPATPEGSGEDVDETGKPVTDNAEAEKPKSEGLIAKAREKLAKGRRKGKAAKDKAEAEKPDEGGQDSTETAKPEGSDEAN